MSPILHPQLDTFLLGFLAAASLFAGLFFLRFWRDTRDPLFFAFAIFFVVQCGLNAGTSELRAPNMGSPMLFLLRLLSVVGVLGAILWKNWSY